MTTPATPAPLPAEAVEAAAEALKARHAEIAGDVIPYDEPELRADLVAIAMAAAPYLVAAEREGTVTAMYAGAAKAVENAVPASGGRWPGFPWRCWATAAGLLRQSGGARVAEDVQSNDC